VDVNTYKRFVEFLEPGSLKEKLSAAIKELEKESNCLKKPVNDLRKEKEFLQIKRDRAIKDLEAMEETNRKLRELVEKPEAKKLSAN